MKRALRLEPLRAGDNRDETADGGGHINIAAWREACHFISRVSGMGVLAVSRIANHIAKQSTVPGNVLSSPSHSARRLRAVALARGQGPFPPAISNQACLNPLRNQASIGNRRASAPP